MKITPKNVANLASVLSAHETLEFLNLNFNFNELDSDDIKMICDSLEGCKLKGLELSFKGCGLPRNAFKKLCIWLQLAIDCQEKLHLDLSLYTSVYQGIIWRRRTTMSSQMQLSPSTRFES